MVPSLLEDEASDMPKSQTAADPARPRLLRADGEATRNRLLDAAGELFADKGFAETTSREIAYAAGTDLASINYHFGNRGGLYRAVLIDAHKNFICAKELEDCAKLDLPPEQLLRELISCMLRGIVEKPGWHGRILAREVLSPSSHFRALEQIEIMPKALILMPLFSTLTGLPSNDPRLIGGLVCVAAPCLLLMTTGIAKSDTLKEAFNGSHEMVVDQLHSFALGGLRALSAAPVKTQ